MRFSFAAAATLAVPAAETKAPPPPVLIRPSGRRLPSRGLFIP